VQLLDSRRLTGANLIMASAGPVVDIAVAEAEADAVVAAWRSNLARMLPAVGIEGATLHVRRFDGGASLAFTAPIDVLYAACEVNEWALEGGDFEEACQRLKAEVDAERNPALLALRAAAAERGVAFLWDDDLASVGLGVGSRSWPADALPAPGDVPWGDVHDIPVVMVTGTNGKSTTVRLLAAMVEAAGKVPGLSSTDWIRVGEDVLDTGDYSGPGGARAVLRDTRCEIAILETARGGMLRRGLGYERADAVAILNVAEDHLGEWGIGDLEGLVDAKFILAQGVKPGGALVLNADEPPVLDRGRALDAARTLWFALDAAHPQLVSHAAAGGETACVAEGMLCLGRGATRQPLAAEVDVPVTFGAKARFNTSNALAAAALAACAGLEPAAIAAGLTQFESSPSLNPGRGNLFEIDGVTVFADFAHNPHGTHAIFAMARAFEAARVGILLGQAGDRTDADVRALVEATWSAQPDLIVVKAMDRHLRGRAEGEMIALIDSELARVGAPAERIEHAGSELEAAERALAWAQPGDLLLLLLHAQRAEVLALLHERAGV